MISGDIGALPRVSDARDRRRNNHLIPSNPVRMPTVINAVSDFARRHTFACIFLSLLALFLLGSAGLECVKIDVRFLFMTGDMTDSPIGPFPTVFGEPYYDYPSTMFVLSWLATFCGRVVARWTVTLPLMVFGAYSIAMTWRNGEKAE